MTFSNPAAALARAVESAQETGQTQWLVKVDEARGVDPLRCYAECGAQDRFFWQRRAADAQFVAWGSVDEIESAGRGRFQDVERWASDLRGRLHWVGAPRPASHPLFVGGFGFADEAASPSEWKSFPAARFVLPATMAEVFEGEARWLEFVRVEPGTEASSIEAEWARRQAARRALEDDRASAAEDPVVLPLTAPSAIGAWPPGPEYRVCSDRPHDVFTGQVAQALERIEEGALEKVVLARSLRVDHDGELDIPLFLERLREMYPTCTLIAIGRGDDTFLAATPETLVKLSRDRMNTAALAGSAPRGRTPEEDASLASDLRSSPKERAEHAHVVDAIREALAPHCEEFEAPEIPDVRALFGIQHLETLISGRVKQEASGVLPLVAALHPTPAVGGVPREAAAQWLRRFEGLDRGWYASPIGWLDAKKAGGGGGDFSVGLRSALIRAAGSGAARASRAWLFAGAGVVEGSEPKAELAETRIKLRALLAPLTEI